MVFGTAALYFGLMLGVMIWAWRKGRGNGGSVRRAMAFAAIGFLLVYLPVFWNHLPVMLTHHAMCAKDAGFNAYVTPEQWLTQNRDELAKLSREDVQRTTASRVLPDGFSRYEHFGGLLATESSSERSTLYGVLVVRVESRLRDTRTNALVASQVDYQLGQHDDARLWFAGRSCFAPGDPNNPSRLRQQFTQRLLEAIK